MFEISVVKYKLNPDSDYIGRGNILGNPFPITIKDSRDSVCDKYEIYFYTQVNHNKLFTSELKHLYEKGLKQGYLKLGCFCKQPNIFVRCHGDTIKSFLENNGDSFFNHE